MSTKIKVAYFDLFHGGWHEDYSINPVKYGGGPQVPRWLKEEWTKPDSLFELTIFAPIKCWEHIDETKENKSCFIDLPLSVCERLRNGENIKNFIPEIDYFDILFHGHTGLAINNINCRGTQVHWSGFGRASDGHPFIPYTFVYGSDLTPYYNNQKTLPMILGKPVPKTFSETKKEDFIFQCSRHDEGIDTIQVAKECIKHKIKAYFGGVIGKGYPLMDYINNQETFYLGSLSEQLKLDYTRRARLYSCIAPFGMPFNQSVIEALASGTPVLRAEIKRTRDPTFRDWLKELIIDGYNGVSYNGDNFLECWSKSKEVSQKNCWETAEKFSVERMVKSIETGLLDVTNNK